MILSGYGLCIEKYFFTFESLFKSVTYLKKIIMTKILSTPFVNRPDSRKNLKDDPEYFGAYLNMARNNLAIIFAYISDAVQKPFNAAEDSLIYCPVIQMLKSNKEPDQVRRVIRQIEKHLPFLKLIVEDVA